MCERNIVVEPIKEIKYKIEKGYLIIIPTGDEITKIKIRLRDINPDVRFKIKEKTFLQAFDGFMANGLPYKQNRFIKTLTTFEITGTVEKWEIRFKEKKDE